MHASEQRSVCKSLRCSGLKSKGLRKLPAGIRARNTPEGRRFGSCLVAVGASATAYHAASGKLRSALRKLDYWTIALASTQMARALFPPTSARLRALNAASWALTPFRPTAVSTLNFGIAEVRFKPAEDAHASVTFLLFAHTLHCQWSLERQLPKDCGQVILYVTFHDAPEKEGVP